MILALETSSSLCAVCLYDAASGKIAAQISNDIGRGHAERLMDDIGDVLKQVGLTYKDVTMLACGVGPGSFTGIRVGVAAARGFALALKLPVHGVTSLQAIALQAVHGVQDGKILTVIDAGREEVYLQTFDLNAVPLDAPRAVHVPDLPNLVRAGRVLICGSGAAFFTEHDASASAGPPVIATASAVAMAAAHPAMRVPPKPLYLRAPDAKPQAGFSIARR